MNCFVMNKKLKHNFHRTIVVVPPTFPLLSLGHITSVPISRFMIDVPISRYMNDVPVSPSTIVLDTGARGDERQGLIHTAM